VDGDYFMSPIQPFELNGTEANLFKATMAQAAPKVPIGEISAISWISADLMIKGLQAAGPCPTRQTLISKLRSSTYDAEGLIAPIDESTQVGSGNPCFWFIKAVGKAFVPESPQPSCGKPLTPSS